MQSLETPASLAAISEDPERGEHPDRSGYGLIEVQRIGGRSVVTRARSHSPLRLLTPTGCGTDAAWVVASSLGGGLVAGDSIEIDLSVASDARCILATQASTKVYVSPTGRAARQKLNARLGERSLGLFLPDPLTCFAGAVFEQQLRFDLSGESSIVAVDWLTSGRRARGERWAFSSYRSRIEVAVAGRTIFRDAILLDKAHGPLDDEHRMGRCNCFAVLFMFGPMVAPASGELLGWSGRQPLSRGSELIFSASPVAGGAVVRVAGPTTESVDQWIRQRLRFVPALVGGDPWRRKM